MTGTRRSSLRRLRPPSVGRQQGRSRAHGAHYSHRGYNVKGARHVGHAITTTVPAGFAPAGGPRVVPGDYGKRMIGAQAINRGLIEAATPNEP